MDRLDRLRLVRVRATDASTGKTRDDPRVEPVREVAEVGWPGWQDRMVDDAARHGWLLEQAGQDGGGVGRGVGAHVGCLSKRTGVRNAASLDDADPTQCTVHV